MIAEQFRVVIWFEDGEWYGRRLEAPDAMNDGKTPDNCIRNVRDILTTHAAAIIERGQPPPALASEGLRDEQIRVQRTATGKTGTPEKADRVRLNPVIVSV